jgi:hypothetical protein
LTGNRAGQKMRLGQDGIKKDIKYYYWYDSIVVRWLPCLFNIRLCAVKEVGRDL